MRRASKGRLTRTARVLLGCAIAAVACGTSWSQTAEGAAEPVPTADSRRALIATGESPDLFLLYTGDVIGYLDPCG